MTETGDPPEPDRVDGAPHPRHTPRVIGQGAAERSVLDAVAAGRVHSGWLLTGPHGVGKATLAWAMARYLLAVPDTPAGGLFGTTQPESLAIDRDHPVARRLRALSDPGLFLLRRGGAGSTEREQEKAAADGRFSAEIRVREVRRLHGFFALSAADGGRRVVIVDAADDLNMQAANAILKMLEEPPARTTLLLVAHQPARLLPTIRSRCRLLRLTPLGPSEMAEALAQAGIAVPAEDAAGLTALSGGSVGTSVRLVTLDGLALYRDLVAVLGSLPRLDRPRLLSLADSCAGKGRAGRLDLALSLTDQLVARIARSGATGELPQEAVAGEAAVLARLAPDQASARRWAAAGQTAGDRARHARAVNMDPATLVTDLLHTLARAG